MSASGENMGLEGWGEYKRLILQELERLNGEVSRLNGKLDGFRDVEISKLKVDVAMLPVKSGLISAVTSTLFAAAVAYVMRK